MLDVEPAILFVGTAGAGKSTLTGATEAYMSDQGMDVLTVNLDPGAEKLPYEPGVDIREMVTIDEVMKRYELGPNGAQVAAADMIAMEFDAIQDQIEAYGPEIMLVDTPGQLELFAFRASGPYVAGQLSQNTMLTFLMDPAVASSPRGFVSQAILAATTHYRLQIPTLNVLGKVDTLSDEAVDEIMAWATDTDRLLQALYEEPATMVNQLNEAFLHVLDDFEAIAKMVPVSAATLEGIEEVYTLATQNTAGGHADVGR